MSLAANKEKLKKISEVISELAHSLEIYVWDEENENVKNDLNKQIAEARNLSAEIDDIIFAICLGKIQ